MSNPYFAQHMSQEMLGCESGSERSIARQVVIREFAGHENAEDKCGKCGSDAFYRPTVGCVMCPSCRAIRKRGWECMETGEKIFGAIAGEKLAVNTWAHIEEWR